MDFYVHVVKVYIPLLLKLKDIKQHGLLLNYIDDQVEQNLEWHSKPVRFKSGHSFRKLNYSEIFLPQSELKRLILQFLHLMTNKVFQLLKFTTEKS